ncbi:hypothetical protein ACP70R_033231 [Stipagrostis hirtigluma subsp. patula]
MRSRNFLLAPRRKDSRSVKIKRSKVVVKFKVCCSKCTLSVFDAEKANKRAELVLSAFNSLHNFLVHV